MGQHDQDQCGGRAPGGVDTEVGVRDPRGHEGASRRRAELVADERLERLELRLGQLEHPAYTRGAQKAQRDAESGQHGLFGVFSDDNAAAAAPERLPDNT